jgi:cytochrome c
MFHLFKSVARNKQQAPITVPAFTINKLSAAGLILTAMLTASACGTPAVGVSVKNPGIVMNATTLPTDTAVPVKIVTAVAAAPTDAMAGMSTPTNSPASGNGSVTTVASATPLVVDYLLFGTPTKTPGPAGQGAPVTATPAIRSSATPVATVADTSVSAPTVSQPTATTVSSFGGAAVTVTPIIRATRVVEGTPTSASTTAPTTVAPTDSAAVATVAATSPATANSPAAAAGGTSPTPDAWTAMNLVGDAAKGQALFQGAAGCNACHNANSTAQLVGPGLKGVAARAATRKPGYTAIQYLHESIVAPNAFVVPGFSAGIMPQTFAQTLTPQQIADLIAYLLSL